LGTEEAPIPLYLRPPDTLVGRHTLIPHRDGVAVLRFLAVSPSGATRETTQEVVLQTISPDKGGTARSSDGVVSIAFEPGRVHDTMYPQVTCGPVTGSPKFLKAMSRSYRFEPLEVSFPDKATITAHVDKNQPQQIALFYRDKQNWRFLARTENAEAKAITASVPHFAEYALFRDTYQPSVSISSPAAQAVLKKPYKPFSVRVDDRGTGLDSSKTVMLLDGKKVPAEYIPKRKRLVYDPFYPLGPGEHTLQVVAVDLVGNRMEKEMVFRVEE
jgi:hypothetical protein